MLVQLCRHGRKNRSRRVEAAALAVTLNLRVDLADQPQVPDLELVAAIASGGSAAFEILHARYERRVFNYVRTFVRQPTIAEEVVIDTMLAVWNGARRFNRDSRVSTWILGIARHKALDAVRKMKNQGDTSGLEQADEIADTAETPADAVARDSHAQLILQAIAELSHDHQEILRLAFYEDLPYEEIGALLSIPDNTVKTRVFYAKQQLKGSLKKLGVESPL
jgi:RNA polymerase sigma-70 factor, ECF subfamily